MKRHRFTRRCFSVAGEHRITSVVMCFQLDEIECAPVRYHRAMRMLAIGFLLLACSCRFIVDPDQFRNDDAGTIYPDAIVVDGSIGDAPAFECGEWKSKYIDIDLTDGSRDSFILPPGEYHLDMLTPALMDGQTGEMVVMLEEMSQRVSGDALVLWRDSVTISRDAIITTAGIGSWPPLIIAAREFIVLEGTLDVSSSRITFGAGANAAECPSSPISGGSTTAMSTGGGGGGGGFGRAGARGGHIEGFDGTAGNGGSAVSASPQSVRGGCPGGDGAQGTDTNIGGAGGGQGGGAVHLVACETIIIDGTVHASGGGGSGGAAGTRAGGGGGGSGGYIGLEASMIEIRPGSILAANGGGGGGGSNNTSGTFAYPGQDGNAGDQPAGGGTSFIPGGSGGAGNISPDEGGIGTDGESGGGGGGGGQGYILLLGNVMSIAPTAVISPTQATESLSAN
jgi:hypothetical protein